MCYGAGVNPALWAGIRVGDVTQCWEWQGAVDNHGYGREGGRQARRLAFADVAGAAPSLLTTTCKNPRCCNPMHMRKGGPGRKRAGVPAWLPPARPGPRHLTARDRTIIRKAVALGVGLRALARHFGTSLSSIRRAVYR